MQRKKEKKKYILMSSSANMAHQIKHTIIHDETITRDANRMQTSICAYQIIHNETITRDANSMQTSITTIKQETEKLMLYCI